ncbi:MAG: SRPBCC family protein [Thermodesulfobacteriota bacterium]
MLVLILAVTTSPAVAAGALAETSFAPLEEQRLAQGQVVVRHLAGRRGQPERVQAAVVIAAPAARVWDTLLDCAGAPRFVPGLQECRVLQQRPGADLIQHRVKFSWLIPEMTYVFLARYQKWRSIHFERVSGDLNQMQGSWLLFSRDQGRCTLLVYSVFLDPGFLVPQWLVSLILEADLPELMLAVRNQAQGALP